MPVKIVVDDGIVVGGTITEGSTGDDTLDGANANWIKPNVLPPPSEPQPKLKRGQQSGS